MRTGYLHPKYALSLAEFGTPRELKHSGGWILERPVAGYPYRDAMGLYPLFTCQDWSVLHQDLESIGDELVTLSTVVDPFGEYDESYLKECFNLCKPFKRHYVVDLLTFKESEISSHHRRYSARALRNVEVEIIEEPIRFLDDWDGLYARLKEKHNIKGIAAFSKSSFAIQLQVPGLVAFRAVHDNETISMALWYVIRDTAYYHLGASDSSGYKMKAASGIFWTAIQTFRAQGLKRLNLGGAAGLDDDPADGLARFKRGWSNDSKMAYFCGRIFDHEAYSKIVEKRKIVSSTFFPAYRAQEII